MYRMGQAAKVPVAQVNRGLPRCDAICSERGNRKGERCQRYGRFGDAAGGPVYCKQHFDLGWASGRS
jgi:hypothetical protein